MYVEEPQPTVGYYLLYQLKYGFLHNFHSSYSFANESYDTRHMVKLICYMVLTQKYVYNLQVSILLILELRFNKIIHSHRKLCTFKENSKKNMGRGRDEGMNEKTLPSPSSGISDYSEINDAYACRYLGLWTLTKTCTQTRSTPLRSIPKLTSGHQI